MPAERLKLEPVDSSTAAQKVVAQLLRELAHGRLRPGTRLPPERELATVLGVSRATVVQALRILEHLGVIEARQGSGRTVRAIGQSGPTGEVDLDSQLESVLRLLEARQHIETGIGELAVERASSEDLERLRQALEAKTGAGDPTEEDVEFHLALAAAGHNPVLQQVMRSLTMEAYYAGIFTSVLPSRAEQISREHRAIYEALAQRDRDALREAIRTHLRNGQASARASAQRLGQAHGGPGTQELAG